MFFRNRVAQIKFVKDSNVEVTEEMTANHLQTAQAYAEIVKDVAGDVASMIITVTVIKTACELARIFATAATK